MSLFFLHLSFHRSIFTKKLKTSFIVFQKNINVNNYVTNLNYIYYTICYINTPYVTSGFLAASILFSAPRICRRV